MDKPNEVDRRSFLSALGVTVGGAGLAGGAMVGGSQLVEAQTAPPKGRIPDTPYKTGHMTFITGPAAVLGDPSLKGHILAAEEINAQGGFLGKRKIETITADENAGTDANVKELRRMKLEGKIDLFTGIISSGNTPALGPVAEELSLLTIFVDGCTDFLFDKAVPQPKYTFRVTNIQSADGITSAIGAAQAWPQVRKIAHLHPDYSYGRNAAEHFTLALERLVPGTQVVSESWPKLGTTDFTAHITKILSSNPDLLFTSVWGGDYVAWYKQAIRYGLFEKMKVATTLAFGVAPHALGKDHPEGVLAGVHSNYHFTYPGGDRWPLNKAFVQRYHKRWNEYPNFQSEGSYVTLYMLKQAIEKANKLDGRLAGRRGRSSVSSRAWGTTPRRAISTSGPTTTRATRTRSSGSARTIRTIRSRPGTPTGSSPFRSATSPRPPTGPSRARATTSSTAAADWIKKTWPKALG